MLGSLFAFVSPRVFCTLTCGSIREATTASASGYSTSVFVAALVVIGDLITLPTNGDLTVPPEDPRCGTGGGTVFAYELWDARAPTAHILECASSYGPLRLSSS